MDDATPEDALSGTRPGERGGFLETRTRVSLFLPSKTTEHRRALIDIVDYFEQQKSADIPVKGFTHSEIRLPVLYGFWLPEDKDEEDEQDWVREKVCLFIIDYEAEHDSDELSNVINLLADFIDQSYFRYTDKHEDKLWIIAQPVTRFLSRRENPQTA